MCGIFGAIGDHINPGIIRALAIANRARGKDSLGVFSNTGKFVKSAGDPMDCLGNGAFDEFIEKTCCKGWFLAGHTRYATHGTITSRNAHPFRYGRIIGCHNGIVDIPLDSPYQVDSEILFDRLNQHNGDYQAAFADLDGYWRLRGLTGNPSICKPTTMRSGSVVTRAAPGTTVAIAIIFWPLPASWIVLNVSLGAAQSGLM